MDNQMKSSTEPTYTVTVPVCYLCRSRDLILAAMPSCESGIHVFCRFCLDIMNKISACNNGLCLLCSMMRTHSSSESIGKDDEAQKSPIVWSQDSANSEPFCVRHPTETACVFCVSCNRLACDKCTAGSCLSHKHIFMAQPLPQSEALSEVQRDIRAMLDRACARTKDLEVSMRDAEDATMQLRMQSSKARLDVDAAVAFFTDQLRDRRVKLLSEIDGVYQARWQRLSTELQEVRSHIDNLQEFIQIVDTMILGSGTSMLSDSMFSQVRTKLQSSLDRMLTYQPKPITSALWVGELEFVTNRQSIQAAVQNCLGYIRQGDGLENECGALQRIASVPASSPVVLSSGDLECSGNNMSLQNGTSSLVAMAIPGGESSMPATTSGPFSSQQPFGPIRYWPDDLNRYYSGGESILGSGNPLFSTVIGAEKKYLTDSSASVESWPGSTVKDSVYSRSDGMLDCLNMSTSQSSIPPVVPTIKRLKMGYHCKFGEFGSRPGQFTEPSGIATNAMNDIIVADTNNHRLEVFDVSGVFKYEILGRQADCELVYPNRLSVCRTTGDIVVTERSPTHQVQVFDRCGNFLRRFGGKVLQHPRGVAVDINGRIVVVECRVMRVVIFDTCGAVINRFSLMGELEFPNGVAVDEHEHIYISDNRAHCVKVYSYAGAFVRTIGGAGITNYPIGVGVDRSGHVVVADNHNNFNVTVFDSDGLLICALESRVKHAHCYDMALTSDGDIVVSSKDFRVYIYRYDIPLTVPVLTATSLHFGSS